MLGKILVTGEIQVFAKTETSYWNLNAAFRYKGIYYIFSNAEVCTL